MAAELFQSHHGTSGKDKEDFWPWNVSLLLSCCSRMQINSWRSACGIVTWALCEIPVSTALLEFGNLMNGKAILHLRPVNEKHLLVLSLSSFSEWFWSGFSIPALLGIWYFPECCTGRALCSSTSGICCKTKTREVKKKGIGGNFH